MNRSRWYSRITRMARHEAGVALIEFAILFPFFFLLLFGGIEVARFIFIQQRLERAGYVVADIATQYLPATQSPVSGEISRDEVIANVFPQVGRIMEPYQDSKRQAVILSSIQVAGGIARVQWQIASTQDSLTGCDTATPKHCVISIVSGLSPGAISPGVKGSVATLPTEMNSLIATQPRTTNIMVAEVFYYYQPILSDVLQRVGRAGGAGPTGFRFFMSPRIFAKTMLFAPRNGEMLYLPPTFPVP